MAVTALTFGPGVVGGFVWDDWALIVRNDYVRNPTSILDVLTSSFWRVSAFHDPGNPVYANVYRPFVKLAYVLEFRCFGEDPLGYHLVSLCLHLACVAMAAAWIRRRLPAGSSDAGAWLAAGLGAAFFGLHPTRPETVTWISGSTDLWMGFWLLAGLLCMDRADGESARGSRFACALICLAFAAFSKEPAALLPLLLVADDLFLYGRRPRWRRVAWVTLAVGVTVTLHLVLIPPHGAGGSFDPLLTLARVTSSLGHYARIVVWPWQPSVQQAELHFDEEATPVYDGWSVALGALLMVGFAIWMARALKRQPERSPYLADALWFVVLLLPVLNIVPISGSALVAERFLFVPLVGLGALVARGLVRLMGRRPRSRMGALALVGALLVAMAAVSVRRSGDFLSDRALWTRQLEMDPRSLASLEHMVETVLKERSYEEALALLARAHQEAVRRNLPYHAAINALKAVNVLVTVTPDADQEALRRARAAYESLRSEHRIDLADPRLRLAVQVPSIVADEIVADVGTYRAPRAGAWARTLELAEAERQLRAIVGDAPRSPTAWHLLGIVLARQGKWDAAQVAAEQALERWPNDPVMKGMAANIASARRLAEIPAPTPMAQALREARVQLALGAPEAARRALAPALDEHPTDPELVMTRARADVADLQFRLARNVLEAARHADPGNEPLWDTALANLERAEHEARAKGLRVSAANAP